MVRLYENIVRRLRDLVAAEGLEPGDRLPSERKLAHQLGVSRASIHQALTSLRTMGVVEPRQGAGVYLRRPLTDLAPTVGPPPSWPRVMEVREALETHAARLAARRRSESDIAALHRAVEEMAAAIRAGEDPADADARFHAAVARAADNPMLDDLMQQLAEPIALTRTASLSRPGRPPRSLEGHRRILVAIEARDEEGAAAAMREHLLLVADVAYTSGVPSTGTSTTVPV